MELPNSWCICRFCLELGRKKCTYVERKRQRETETYNREGEGEGERMREK